MEARIFDAIDAIRHRDVYVLTNVAREFVVPYKRLRNRYLGTPSKSEVSGLHLRRLETYQEEPLHRYLKEWDDMGLPHRYSFIILVDSQDHTQEGLKQPQ